MDLRQLDLDVLNSATKYPSIPTYHPMGDKGRLGEVPQVVFRTPVYATEKVDGVNARIIFTQDPSHPYIMGSREEFLHAAGDLVYPSSFGLVDTLRPVVRAMTGDFLHHLWQEASHLIPEQRWLTVIYGEVFGNLTSQARNVYTKDRENQFRIFDVGFIPVHVLGWDVARVASWRDDGGQRFLPHHPLREAVRELDNAIVSMVPEVFSVPEMPTTLQGVYGLLCEKLPTSKVIFGEDATGRPEGVVLRSFGGSKVAKVRFIDYERTLGVRR